MKRLSLGVVLLGALAATAWFVWAAVTDRAVAAWFAEREAEGWVVETQDLSVGGFPARFETVIEGVSLADPSTGWAWSAPELVLQQGALTPGRIEAIWPATQTLASPYERLTITAAALSSALDVQPVNNLALDASETRMESLRVESNAGWHMTLAEGQADMLRLDGAEATYDLQFHAHDLVLPAEMADALDPAGVLPEAIPVVIAAAQVRFDRQWDLSAIEVARPQIERLDLSEIRAEWGDLLLRITGAVDVDGEGRASGAIAIRAENWEEMLAMSVRGGVLSEGMANTARTALGFLANMSGRPEDLDATLRLEEGFAYLGPLPIGEAPRLILR